MWDWVGGRTSVTSVVGLLPAALQGVDTTEMLAGARAMDAATRVPDVASNRRPCSRSRGTTPEVVAATRPWSFL